MSGPGLALNTFSPGSYVIYFQQRLMYTLARACMPRQAVTESDVLQRDPKPR
jgi:hypothetical protein